MSPALSASDKSFHSRPCFAATRDSRTSRSRIKGGAEARLARSRLAIRRRRRQVSSASRRLWLSPAQRRYVTAVVLRPGPAPVSRSGELAAGAALYLFQLDAVARRIPRRDGPPDSRVNPHALCRHISWSRLAAQKKPDVNRPVILRLMPGRRLSPDRYAGRPPPAVVLREIEKDHRIAAAAVRHRRSVSGSSLLASSHRRVVIRLAHDPVRRTCATRRRGLLPSAPNRPETREAPSAAAQGREHGRIQKRRRRMRSVKVTHASGGCMKETRQRQDAKQAEHQRRVLEADDRPRRCERRRVEPGSRKEDQGSRREYRPKIARHLEKRRRRRSSPARATPAATGDPGCTQRDAGQPLNQLRDPAQKYATQKMLQRQAFPAGTGTRGRTS